MEQYYSSLQMLLTLSILYLIAGIFYIGICQFFTDEKNTIPKHKMFAFLTLWWIYLLARIVFMILDFIVVVIKNIFKRSDGGK